jgi:hypothetical protein
MGKHYEDTYTIDIYVAGDIAQAKQICREFCRDGFCVHIVPASYIYTGGQEEGVKVGLVNYPRFPLTRPQLSEKAYALAEKLINGLCQTSALCVNPDESIWITTRGDA